MGVLHDEIYYEQRQDCRDHSTGLNLEGHPEANGINGSIMTYLYTAHTSSDNATRIAARKTNLEAEVLGLGA